MASTGSGGCNLSQQTLEVPSASKSLGQPTNLCLRHRPGDLRRSPSHHITVCYELCYNLSFAHPGRPNFVWGVRRVKIHTFNVSCLSGTSSEVYGISGCYVRVMFYLSNLWHCQCTIRSAWGSKVYPQCWQKENIDPSIYHSQYLPIRLLPNEPTPIGIICTEITRDRDEFHSRGYGKLVMVQISKNNS